MKVDLPTLNVERSGVIETIKCRIGTNIFAFRSIVHQYENPIRACIQEIYSNAVDSHRRAGIPINEIDVHIPTAFNDTFSIRDYGVSMSPEKVRQVYSVLMESDKRNTNDEIGCFGIGAIAPLSYVSMFNLTTYLNGVARHYTVGYGEDGVPELNLLVEISTNEPNGVKVDFCVKKDDISQFESTAIKFFQFAEELPQINVDVPRVEPLVKVGNYELWPRGSIKGVHLVIDCVPYNVSSSTTHRISSTPVVIRAKIGDVDLVPSRERLEFTPKTRKFIDQEFNRAYTELFDACKKLEFSTFNELINFKYKKLTYPFTLAISTPDIRIKSPCTVYFRGNRINTIGTRRLKNKLDSLVCPRCDKIVVLDPDGQTGVHARARKLASQNRGWVIVVPKDDADPDSLFEICGITKESDRHLKIGYETIKASSISIDTNAHKRSHKRSTSNKQLYVLKFLGRSNALRRERKKSALSSYWKEILLDPQPGEKYYYVLMKNYQPTLPFSIGFYDLLAKNYTIVGLNACHRSATKHPQLHPIEELFDEYMSQLTDRDIRTTFLYIKCGYDDRVIEAMHKVIPNVDSNITETHRIALHLIQRPPFSGKFQSYSDELDKDWKDVHAKYPLLDVVVDAYSCHSISFKDVTDYIDLVDGSCTK